VQVERTSRKVTKGEASSDRCLTLLSPWFIFFLFKGVEKCELLSSRPPLVSVRIKLKTISVVSGGVGP